MAEFTHFDENGNARMVDVSEKDVTRRTAIATGSIKLSREAMDAVLEKRVKKGDVLTVAQTAGIMATKRTAEIIPMCHPLSLTNVELTFETDAENCVITVYCSTGTDGRTGVEMEALSGVMVALLTVYDMCKSIDRHMEMGEIHLIEKTGGKSGDFRY